MSEFRGEGLGEGSNSKPLASEVSGSEHSAERFGPAYLESGASASSATPVPATPVPATPVPAPTSQPPYRSPYAPPAPSYAASSQAATGSSPYAQPGPELPPGAAPMRARTRREPRRVRRSAALAAAAGALMLGLAGGVLGSQGFLNPAEAPPTVPPDAAPTPTPTPAPADPDPAPIGAAGATVAEVAAQVLPSTVYIEVVAPQGMSSGTGMILRSDGYLVTNNHVIAAGADNPGATIQVTFSDGDVQDATVVGRTQDYDIAVLQVDRTDLVPLPLADSAEVVVGDPVVAVGAPLGLDGTVTSGIVSALNRAVTAGSAQEVSYINAIQTDAAINPGNSGGPLVNMSGEVIGINSAIAQPPGASRATGSIGLGFAIPANQVERTTEQLITLGHATYPIIGVLLDGRHMGEGVLVSPGAGQDGTPAITPDGPGEEAGVEPGDIILRLDGRPVTSPDEVIVTVRSHAPGDTVTLDILRDGEEIQIPIVLGERQAN